MKEIEKLLAFRISEIEKEIDALSSSESKPLKEDLEKLEKVFTNELLMKDINFKELNEKYNIFSKKELEEIALYIHSFNYPTIQLKPERKENVLNSINNAINVIKDKLSKLDVGKKYHQEKEQLEILKAKIKKMRNPNNNVVYLNKEDIALVCDTVRKCGYDLNLATDFIVDLTTSSINVIQNTNFDEEEFEDVEETNIDKKDVEALFKKHNYDFMTLQEKDRELILKYAQLDNMEEIFKMLESFNAHLNISKIPDLYSGALANILVYSKPQLISDVLSVIKNDYNALVGENVAKDLLPIFYNKILPMSSLFVFGNKRTKSKNETNGPRGPGGPYKPSDIITGKSEEFKAICTLLHDKGINVVTAVDQCKTIFLERSSVMVERNLKILDLYNIDPTIYQDSLYGPLMAPDIAGSLDAHFEQGLKQYVFKNMSSLKRNPNTQTFYRVKRFNQEITNTNKGNLEDLYAKNGGLKSIYTTARASADNFNINETNGPVITKQYFPKNPRFVEYDALFDVKDARGPLELVHSNFFIIKLEENFKQDFYTYNINGVIISRIKVLRIYEELIKRGEAGTIDSVLYALSKNSILTLEEYHTIDEAIDLLFSKGVVRK